MTDLSAQINLINTKLSEQLTSLEQEYQRWSDYKSDYNALENQLKTLPDSTTRSAMVPLGKLAFMPGKLVHTNEILVLLGGQYYAERSAKQAIEILGRRRQVVDENLRLVEAQLNSFKAKKDSILDAGSLSKSDPQLNEEGLPIMEIREPVDEKQEQEKQKKKKLLEGSGNNKKPFTNQLPESVLRARKMMEEADSKKNHLEKDAENKALFDLLKELEAEEEEDLSEEIEPISAASSASTTEKKQNQAMHTDDQDSDESIDDFSDDEEDDERYDTEICDNMFDRFGDDEQYPLDGIVDQEDFTCYDQVPPATLREINDEEFEELYEKSTPKVITKKKTQQEPAAQEASTPKKISKFKLAQQEKNNNNVKVSSPLKQEPMIETVPLPTVEDSNNEAPKKKFSKFKLLRQEQKERTKPVAAVSTAPVKEAVSAAPVKETVPKPSVVSTAKEEKEDIDLMYNHNTNETKKPNQGIPQVVSVNSSNSSRNSHKPKKMSRFKLQRAQSKQPEEEEKEEKEPKSTTTVPLVAERIKPKRSVTWDANTDVRDHDHTSAPSIVSETLSYSQPMKTASSSNSIKKKSNVIRSPADIFNTIRHTQGEIVDDYPSLNDDDDSGEQMGQQVDLNELVQVARNRSEASIYRSADGSEALIPMVNQFKEQEDDEEKPNGIIVAKKNKLDNKVMKGAVMERDIEPVDLEQVEDDMDLREITSSYQLKRQKMLAATGGFSFAPKPEFEVIDEELPLPKKEQKQTEDDEEEQVVAPKKMSRFKAARLGMRMDTATTDENY